MKSIVYADIYCFSFGRPLRFHVVEELNHSIIIGVESAEEFGLVQIPAKESPKDLVYVRDDRLQIYSPIFESAKVLPFAAPAYRRSHIDKQITRDLLPRMKTAGHIRKVDHGFPYINQELLLVDKMPSAGPRIFAVKETNRYRVVLDCRATNALRYSESSQSWIVADQVIPSKKDSSLIQSQRCALDLLGDIPVRNRKFKLKLGISNAFYSISISESMQRLFRVSI